MTTDADREHGEQVRARLDAIGRALWVGDERHLQIRDDDHDAVADLYSESDFALILHAPDDLARLLARAERAEQERDQALAKIARVETLLPVLAAPLRQRGTGFFEGFAGSRSEHRTVGTYRAWSYDDSEWCYPSAPCPSCVPLVLPEDLRAALADPEQPHGPDHAVTLPSYRMNEGPAVCTTCGGFLYMPDLTANPPV